jgi:hypothetical protein
LAEPDLLSAVTPSTWLSSHIYGFPWNVQLAHGLLTCASLVRV